MDPADKLKQAFIINHAFLLKKATADEVLVGTCFAKKLITETEQADVLAERTDSRRLNKLLMSFHRRSHAEKDVFQRFMAVLVKYNKNEGGQVSIIGGARVVFWLHCGCAG